MRLNNTKTLSYIVEGFKSDQVHLILKLNTLSMGESLRNVLFVSQDWAIYGACSGRVFEATVVHRPAPGVHVVRIVDNASCWFTS